MRHIYLVSIADAFDFFSNCTHSSPTSSYLVASELRTVLWWTWFTFSWKMKCDLVVKQDFYFLQWIFSFILMLFLFFSLFKEKQTTFGQFYWSINQHTFRVDRPKLTFSSNVHVPQTHLFCKQTFVSSLPNNMSSFQYWKDVSLTWF